MDTKRTLFINAAIILILASFLVFACKEAPIIMEEAFDKSLLFNKWYLQSGIIVENGLKRPLTIDSCKLVFGEEKVTVGGGHVAVILWGKITEFWGSWLFLLHLATRIGLLLALSLNHFFDHK